MAYYNSNSDWAVRNRDYLNKLNDIMNDEYCVELELSRKIEMLKKFEHAFNNELNNLNWDNIINYMHSNNWGYGWNNELQNREQFEDFLRNDFFKHGLYRIIKMNQTSYSTFSGGFAFDMGITSSGVHYVNIYFDIAHFRKY